MVLPKTADEKNTFDACFDQFFRFQDVRGESTSNSEDGSEQAGEESGEGGDGEGGGAGGDQTQNRSKKKSKSKAKKNNLYEEEEEADLGPGEVTDAHSPLGKLLMANSQSSLSPWPRPVKDYQRGNPDIHAKRSVRATHHGSYGAGGFKPRNQRSAHGLSSTCPPPRPTTQAAA